MASLNSDACGRRIVTNREHSKQTEAEAVDWIYIAIATAIIVALILAATIGHHVVSLEVRP